MSNGKTATIDPQYEVGTVVREDVWGRPRVSLRANSPKTHCVNGHEFTPENVYRKPNGKRYCRTCSIARSRARRAV